MASQLPSILSYSESMRKKDNHFTAQRWTVVFTLLLVLCSTITFSQTNAALECARKDTLEVHPLKDAEDVRTLLTLIKEGRKYDIYPSADQLEKAIALSNSLDLRKERVKLAYTILYIYVYEEADLTKQVSIAMILAKDLEYLDTKDHSTALNLIGNVSSSAGDHISALSFYQRAYETADSLQPLNKLYPLGNLAATYLSNQDTATAIQMLHRSTRLVKSIDIPEEVAYNNVYDFSELGGIHLSQGHLDSAQYYLTSAKNSSEFFDSDHPRFKEIQITLLPNLIRYYIKEGDSNSAGAYIDALDKSWPELALLLKAEHFQSIGHLSKALALTSTPIKAELALDKKRIELRKTLSSALGRYKIADEANAQLLQIAEETLAKSIKELVTISKAQMEASEKEREADIVRYESKLELLKTRQRNWIAAALILLSLGIALWFNQRYRKSHKRTLNLSKIVSQHEKDLIEANEQLASKVKSMERFNHLLSHDLREPLRSISGFTSILSRKAKAYTDLTGDFEMLSRSVEQLTYLMTGVEELRRVEERTLEPKQVDLNEVITKVSNEVNSKYASHEITYEVKGNFTPVILDEKFLINSLLELVDNGAKFCDDKIAHITIEIVQQENELKIYVQDEGIGMNIEFSEQIFGIFKRLNRRENYVGSGVGLSLVKLATEKCKGSVELLESQLGKGSTFMLSFPLLDSVPPVKRRRTSRRAVAQA